MKLYHYVSKPNDVLEKGLFSFAYNKNADISYYTKRSNATNKEDIIKWMESCFVGRSRAIRGFSEPIKYHKKSAKMFKNFIANSNLFSIDVKALEKDGLIEDIYLSPAMQILDKKDITYGTDEVLQKLDSIDKIGSYEVDWLKCDDKLELRFSVIPYYLIIIKGGIIPPKYITKEN